MKIRFVTEGSVNEYWESGARAACDVLVFGFDGLGEVDYAAELAGETQKLEDMAILSREAGCAVLSGCITDSCGIRHKSVAVAEKGRILGVSDMLHIGEADDVKSGAHLKVYDTQAGKLGVCVGEDIFYPSVASALALFDADVIFNIFGAAEDSIPQLMLRACAFTSGVGIGMCARGIAQFSSPEGEIVLRCVKRECELVYEPQREYRLTGIRSRGLCQRRREDY